MDEQNIRLQQEAKQYVHSVSRWYNFFAVVYIVGAALTLLGGVAMILLGFLGGDQMEEELPFPMWILGVAYVVLSGTLVPMIVFLLKAAKYAGKGVGLNNNEQATRFLRFTKSYWKYYGILTIVMLALTVLAIPLATLWGVSMAV